MSVSNSHVYNIIIVPPWNIYPVLSVNNDRGSGARHLSRFANNALFHNAHTGAALVDAEQPEVGSAELLVGDAIQGEVDREADM